MPLARRSGTQTEADTEALTGSGSASAERAFNIVHWSSLPRGGHFAAWEVPELLAQDIRAFFRPLRAGAVSQQA